MGPHTLFLCFSPVLGYGLAELRAKLVPPSALLVVEADPALHGFSLSAAGDLLSGAVYLGPGDIAAWIPARLGDMGTFRRCVRLDMSAGTQFHGELYHHIHRAVDKEISRFWRNRLTLIRLGRLFSRNLFKNLPALGHSPPLPVGKITAPVVVLGAGPSADDLLRGGHSSRLGGCFVIACDAALPALAGALPNVAVQMESQAAIDDAWFGTGSAHAVLDMTARSAGARQRAGRIGWFFTEYTDARFIRRMRDAHILPLILPPLGSVGLSAVQLALMLRANDQVPVSVIGLDFSFVPGKTHCAGSMQHRRMLLQTNRLHPPGAVDSAFRGGVSRARGKDGRTVHTDPALSGYRDSFQAFFAGTPNLYDAGRCGLPLGIPQARHYPPPTRHYPPPEIRGMADEGLSERVTAFLRAEREALAELRGLLAGGGREERIYEILADHEYLYLHFPDGWELTPEKALDQSFLKRVRAEVQGFLKIMPGGGPS
jgi:hypothetical protein